MNNSEGPKKQAGDAVVVVARRLSADSEGHHVVPEPSLRHNLMMKSNNRKRFSEGSPCSLGMNLERKRARKAILDQERNAADDSPYRSVSDEEDNSQEAESAIEFGLDALATAAGDHVEFSKTDTAGKKESSQAGNLKNEDNDDNKDNEAKQTNSPSADESDLKMKVGKMEKRDSLSSDEASTDDDKQSKNEAKWFNNFEALKVYKKKNGHCIVPRGYAGNPKLGAWVAVQRKQYRLLKDSKQSAMTQDRVEILNDIGFAWNAQARAWDRHLMNFTAFRREYGHSNVPVNHPKYPQLHLWVREQRRHYALMQQGKKSHMTPDRVEELNGIGFCWDTCEAQWSERLQELTDFQDKHGHCVIPPNYGHSPKLGSWVSNQRRLYKNSKGGKPGYMPDDRIAALDGIGFDWAPRDKDDLLDLPPLAPP